MAMISSEFFQLSLNKEQCLEIYRALLARFVVEDTMRREQNLEPIEYPKLLEHLEQLLQITSEQAHAVFHKEEDELWEYSGYTFTDEWAWFRAKQDTLKELGQKAERTPTKALESRMEALYEERFDRYTAEVDMQEIEENNKRNTRRSRIQKK